MELFPKLFRVPVAAVTAVAVMLALIPAAAFSAGTPAQLYERHCAACHGENGDGNSRAQVGLDPPPRDFTTAQAWEELSRERMVTSVTYGRPGTAMVGWGGRLSKEQIAGVVDHIRSTFMHPPDEGREATPGRRLYKRHCAACHGDKGSGATWTEYSLDPAPRDFTAPAAREELSRERMITSVTYGRPGTAMMPFRSRLEKREIGQVVDYIRTSFMAEGDTEATSGEPSSFASAPSAPPPQTVIVDMAAAFPHGLVGDRDAGRQFFMGNCATCHGKQGDGKGPRASFIEPPPRNFLAARSRRTLNRPALFEAISGGKQGTVMPAWATVLSEQQIANIAEFVFTTFIRPSGAAQGPTAVKKKPLKD